MFGTWISLLVPVEDFSLQTYREVPVRKDFSILSKNIPSYYYSYQNVVFCIVSDCICLSQIQSPSLYQSHLFVCYRMCQCLSWIWFSSWCILRITSSMSWIFFCCVGYMVCKSYRWAFLKMSWRVAVNNLREIGSPSLSIEISSEAWHHLVGLVVKASASRVEDPGFESRLRRDFFRVKSYQWLKNWYSSGYPARRLAL